MLQEKCAARSYSTGIRLARLLSDACLLPTCPLTVCQAQAPAIRYNTRYRRRGQLELSLDP